MNQRPVSLSLHLAQRDKLAGVHREDPCTLAVASKCLTALIVVQCGRMPIHLAALRGQADVLALLCDHGSPLNDADADGSAPLHKALTQGHVEAAQHLLAYGADAKQTLQVTINSSPEIP